MNTDFSAAITALIVAIVDDYRQFTDKDQSSDEFLSQISVKHGKAYTKVIIRNSVWGFIVNRETDKKFPKGTILKAASWASPARNAARGNILSNDFSWVQWTGPAYL